MQRHRALSTGAVGSAALRGALAVAALSALFLVGLLVPGASEGSGPFNVNGSVARLRISYDGGCTPGQLTAKLGDGKINASPPTLILLTNQGDVFGCTGTAQHPFALIIGTELFSGANVSTVTTDWLSATAQPSLTLEVEDCTAFPDPGNIYVGAELMSTSGNKCDGVGGQADYFTITGRAVTRPGPGGPATVKVGHAVGRFVRAQGRLLLVARSRPRYTGGTATGPAQHDLGSLVRSPMTYLTCRARMKQWAKSGRVDVESRSRCYAILELGYETAPAAPHWPDDPPAGPRWPNDPPGSPQPIATDMPLTGLIPYFYHDISTGTIDVGTGQMVLTTGISGVNCFEFVAGGLWVKVTQQITVNTKQPLEENQTPVKHTGTSYISLYTNSTCEEPWSLRLGSENNVESAALVPSRDTDGDGCSDFEELGDDEKKGGKRDPFNRWDFFDFNKDKYVDSPNDILQVILRYSANPALPYSPNADRGRPLGPSAWNRSGPNGSVDAPNDITGIKFQYQHNCRPAP